MDKIELYAPEEYWRLSEEERSTYRCGPGRGILEQIIPEFILGVCITPACAIHDFMYREGKASDEDKHNADLVFLNNIVRLIEESTKYKVVLYPRLLFGFLYYWFVKVFGGPAFWKNKNLPEQMGLVKG